MGERGRTVIIIIIIITVKIARQLELSQQFRPRLSTEGFRVIAGYALFPKVNELVSFVFHHPVFQAAKFTATYVEIKKLSAKSKQVY